MNLLTMATDAMKNVANFLLPGEPFKLIKPISIVSSKPVEIGTTNTKTVTTYEAPSKVSVIQPAKVTYIPNVQIQVGDTIKNIITAPDSYYLTAQAKSSGVGGNIFDIIGKGIKTVIDTGFNVLMQKVENFGQSIETVYIPSAPSSNKSTTSTSFPDTLISKILNPIIQPAIQSGIKEGITATASKPPNWIIISIIAFAAILLLRRK